MVPSSPTGKFLFKSFEIVIKHFVCLSDFGLDSIRNVMHVRHIIAILSVYFIVVLPPLTVKYTSSSFF